MKKYIIIRGGSDGAGALDYHGTVPLKLFLYSLLLGAYLGLVDWVRP